MKKALADIQSQLLKKQISTGDKLLTVFNDNFFSDGKEEIDKMQCELSKLKEQSQSHQRISSFRKTIRHK
ncbi:hypothetical protein [Acetobacterium malicum]|uniref:hypothetical protein n=1 Tax=Acetobacterium malicum TaxID=52692 RepID=UPI00041BEE24|nr:hypothetical protein [Acetobacterium dehalogenans]